MDKVTREYRAFCAAKREQGLPQPSFSVYMRMRRQQKPAKKSIYTSGAVRQSPKVPSGDSFSEFNGGTRKENNYTGDRLLGIATMHKSNSVPVFRKQDAEDIAKMRRN